MHKFKIPLLLFIGIAWIVGPSNGLAQTLPTNYQGLAVGQPKRVDARDLEARLRLLQNRLRALTFIDQPSLAAAVGKIQGAESEARALNISANLLLPTTLVEEITKTTEKTGEEKKTEKTNTTTEKKEPPTATTQTATAAAQALPNLQLGARALLREQIELEITNIVGQINLMRTIGDRVLSRTSALGDRQRTVLAIPLSVEPKYPNAVADFEITLTFNTDVDNIPGNTDKLKAALGPVQLIGMYPESTSYNKSVYSQSSSGFSGTALIQPLGLGFAQSTDRKEAYLVQDQDLIAYHLGSSKPNEIRIKYQIRPVLSRKSVEAGIRHVLIDVSLPFPNTMGYKVKTDVKSYWSFYDRGRGRTTGLIGGTTHSDQTVSEITGLSVQGDANYMAPQVFKVDWVDIGSDKMLIDVWGERFLEGTTVVIGQSQYVQAFASGMPSESHVALIASVQDVLSYGGTVVGPYGESSAMIDPREDDFDGNRLTYGSSAIEGIEPNGDINAVVKLKFAPDPGTPTNFKIGNLVTTGTHPSFLRSAKDNRPDIDTLRLLVRGGNRIYGTSKNPIRTTTETVGRDNFLCLHFTTSRADALTEKFEVFRPFKAGATVFVGKLDQSSIKGSVESVAVVSKGTKVTLAVKGTRLSGSVKLVAGDVTNPRDPDSRSTSSLLLYEVPASELKTVSSLVFLEGVNVVGILPFNGEKFAPAEPPAPIKAPTMAAVTAGAVRVIPVTLPEGLVLKEAWLQGVDLKYDEYVIGGEKVKAIVIDLRSPKMIGEFDILFRTEDKKLIVGKLKVQKPEAPAKT